MSSVPGLSKEIDELHSRDLDALPDAGLEALAVDVDRQFARLAAERARILAAVDARRTWAADGSRSCAAWLARKRNGSRAAAGGCLRLGRSLARMPLVDAALAAGDIGIEHARELADCLRFKPEVFVEAEADLLRHAITLRWEDFLRVCAAWRDAVDPDGADRTADRVHDRRHLILYRRPDGSLVFQSGLMDPVAAEAFLNELERIERQLFEEDWAEAKAGRGGDVRMSDLHRTNAQRRADALEEMAYRSGTAPADGKRPDPLVSVYIDYQTATGRLCELASGVPVTPGQLLPIFTKADIERIVFGPRNRVIELGVRDRFFTGGLRRAIELRDRHCQHPGGCTEPASRCQADHKVAYTDGGLTVQDNGRLACAKHNRDRNRQPWPDEPDPSDLDRDVENDDEDTPEEIERQRRRCRARLRELVTIDDRASPRKRPPAWSTTTRTFFTDPIPVRKDAS